MVTPLNKWMPFQEFFALSHEKGVDQVTAAEELLERLKIGGPKMSVIGTLRKWDSPSDAEIREWQQAEYEFQDLARKLENIPEELTAERDSLADRLRRQSKIIKSRYRWKERLPRDTQHKPLPKTLWTDLESVNPSLISSWENDQEDIEEFLVVDWIAGTLKLNMWIGSDADRGRGELTYLNEEYSGLHVERSKATELLKRLAGDQNTRGAPKGPKDPLALKLLRKVKQARREGDTRETGRIVTDLLREEAIKLSAEQENLLRRKINYHDKNESSDEEQTGYQ